MVGQWAPGEPFEMLTEGLKLTSYPLAEVEQSRQETRDFGSFTLGANKDLALLENSDTYDIEREVDLPATGSERVCLELMKTGAGNRVLISYDSLDS